MKLELKHLIGAVAAAGFLAVVFGTLGVLVVREVKLRAEWQRIQEDMLREVPSYLEEDQP